MSNITYCPKCKEAYLEHSIDARYIKKHGKCMSCYYSPLIGGAREIVTKLNKESRDERDRDNRKND